MKRFKLKTQELRKSADAITKPYKTFLVCFLNLETQNRSGGRLATIEKNRLATLKHFTCKTVDKPPLLYPSPPLHRGSPTAPPTPSLVAVTTPPPTTLVSVVAGTEVIYFTGC